MLDVRPHLDAPPTPVLFLGAVAVALLFAISLPTVHSTGPPSLVPDTVSYSPPTALAIGRPAGSSGGPSIEPVGSEPSEAGAGDPATFSWQSLGAGGARLTGFAVACELTVTETVNGSSGPAWVNSSTAGPLSASANGTFSVPAAAWSAGVLNLSITFAAAVPETVRLLGPSLPSLPAPVALTILPDLEHLALYDPYVVKNTTQHGTLSNVTFWHVRDRFGDPAPGASLIVDYSSGGSVNRTFVPVVWSTAGTTGAWVNYSANVSVGGTLTVLDGAGSKLLGPLAVTSTATGPAASASSLSPLAEAVVALLAAGGLAGMVALLSGGRPRPSSAAGDEDEELRRLAEGRATVVELVRRAGSLSLHEIEVVWEPPPAPPALADWVASLVTDGTLTAALGEGGRAKFALAAPSVGKPRVTLDEEAFERGIARRDAAVGPDEDEEKTT